jgi:hypothetical protein
VIFPNERSDSTRKDACIHAIKQAPQTGWQVFSIGGLQCYSATRKEQIKRPAEAPAGLFYPNSLWAFFFLFLATESILEYSQFHCHLLLFAIVENG